MTDKTPYCSVCQESFDAWMELAVHIMSMPKRTHGKGRVWAANYISEHSLSQQAQNGERKVITGPRPDSSLKERDLTGNTELVLARCPQCKGVQTQRIPVEYSRSKEAWRGPDGKIYAMCSVHVSRTYSRNT